MLRVAKYLTITSVLTTLVFGNIVLAQQPPDNLLNEPLINPDTGQPVLDTKGKAINKYFQAEIGGQWHERYFDKDNKGNYKRDRKGNLLPPISKRYAPVKPGTTPEPGGKPGGPVKRPPAGGGGIIPDKGLPGLPSWCPELDPVDHNFVQSRDEELQKDKSNACPIRLGIESVNFSIAPEAGLDKVTVPILFLAGPDVPSGSSAANLKFEITALTAADETIAIGSTEATAKFTKTNLVISLQNLSGFDRDSITSIQIKIQPVSFVLGDGKEKQTWTEEEIARKNDLADQLESAVNKITEFLANRDKEVSRNSGILASLFYRKRDGRGYPKYLTGLVPMNAQDFNQASVEEIDKKFNEEHGKSIRLRRWHNTIKALGPWMVKTLRECLTKFRLDDIPDDVIGSINEFGWPSKIREVLKEKGLDEALQKLGDGFEKSIRNPDRRKAAAERVVAIYEFIEMVADRAGEDALKLSDLLP